MIEHIAITGATGFIGAAVLRDLLSRKLRVTVLLRPESNCDRWPNLKGIQTLVYSKLNDTSVVRTLQASRPDAFVHCAWRGVAGGERNEPYHITLNLPMTVESVELAAAAGCKHWVGLGSQAEYGNPNRKVAEDGPLAPVTVYGKAKLAAGMAASALCQTTGLTFAWLRVFSTYGPDDAPHWLIPYVIRELLVGHSPNLTACEQRWDYLFVRDAAEVIGTVAATGITGIYNVGSGQAYLLKEIVELIRHQLASSLQASYGSLPYRPDQVMHLQADITRLQKATGWNPRTSLNEGIRQTIEFQRGRVQRGAGLQSLPAPGWAESGARPVATGQF
jgi:UDP-glucose 4-epimerase